jgi:multiple sugar transport system substrate-binding protein
MSRRDFVRMTILGAGGAVVAACAPRAEPVEKPAVPDEPTPVAPAVAQPVTITFMGWGGVEEDEGVRAAIKVFEEETPNVKVTWMHTPEAYQEKLLAYIAAATPPDTAFVREDYYATLVRDKLLLDITEQINADPLLGQEGYFVEPLETDRCAIEGRWYGTGSCWTLFHIYYNADIFAAAGVEPPSNDPEEAWTWDHFVEVGRELTRDAQGRHPGESGFDIDNVTQWGVHWSTAWHAPVIPLALTNGGHFYNRDEGKFTLDQPNDAEGIQRLADLIWVQQVMPELATFQGLGLTAGQLLDTGRLAMAIDGSWALTWIHKIGPTLGTAVLPKMKVPATFARAHLHSVFAATKQPEASWLWVRFLSTPFYQSQFCRSGLWLPSQSGLMTEEGLKTWMSDEVHPPGFEKIVKDYMGRYAHTFVYPINWTQAMSHITPALEAVWNGEPAKEVLAEPTAQANAVIEPL